MVEEFKSDFCIQIDFCRQSKNPQRVFKAMQELIIVFSETDKTLVESIDASIEPELILEDIEVGSLRTWFSELLKEVDDEALRNLDWKPQVGKYLVKAKYAIIDFIADRSTITDRKEIENLQNRIYKLAGETEANRFPAYSKPGKLKLLQNINSISEALDNLGKNDSADFITPEGTAHFNMEFEFSPESIEELLIKQEIANKVETILKVKKPDYLGESMWDFKYEGKAIGAKILHAAWLKRFQSREIDIRPGDSLRVELNIIAKYGYDNNHITTKYEVLKVLKVEKSGDNGNLDLFK